MKFTPITDAELKLIDRETKERDQTEPRLAQVRFDAQRRELQLQFKDGVALSVPLHCLKGFDGADDEQIAAAKIVANGAALHWDELDVQMTTIALIQRAFKFTTARENGQPDGRVSITGKVVSRLENGKSVGRPRKETVSAA